MRNNIFYIVMSVLIVILLWYTRDSYEKLQDRMSNCVTRTELNDGLDRVRMERFELNKEILKEINESKSTTKR